MSQQTFIEYVKEFSNYKLKERGTNKVSRRELRALRESFPGKEKVQNRVKIKEAFDSYVKGFQKRKFEKVGEKRITKIEYTKLKESFKNKYLVEDKSTRKLTESEKVQARDEFKKVYENYKNWVKKSKGDETKVTQVEFDTLKERFLKSFKEGKKLQEADMGFDPAAGGAPAPVAGDPNAGAMPPAAAVDPTIVAQVQDAKNSIDALAAAVGVQSADPNADPNAAIPAIDGMQQPPAADPNAAPMMESTETKKDELTKIKERILARKQALAQNQKLEEGAAADWGKAELSRNGIGGGIHSNSEEYAGAEGTPEQVVVPAAGSLANGYTSGKAAGETKAAKTWPTKATKTSDTGGALQGAGANQKKIKEECEECEEEKKEDKLEESQKDVTSVYLDNYFAPKLDFAKLRESFSKNLLG